MKKTSIKAHENTVTVTFKCRACKKLHEREFFVQPSGGYVYEHFRDGDTPQVCERLHWTGFSLEATPERLLKVIREEWQRFRSDQKKFGSCLLS